MANSSTQATVNNQTNGYVRLRVSSMEESEWTLGGTIVNGSTVQVLSQHNVFYKVQVQSDAATLVGFVKAHHLDFGTSVLGRSLPALRASNLPVAIAARLDNEVDFVALRLRPDVCSSFISDCTRIPNGTKLWVLRSEGDFTEVLHRHIDGREFQGFVKTQYLEIDPRSSVYAMIKFQEIKDTGSVDDRWKWLKAYIVAKQREVSDYHLQHVRPMEQLMSMKALETIKARALA
jgi:hypothetical protein